MPGNGLQLLGIGEPLYQVPIGGCQPGGNKFTVFQEQGLAGRCTEAVSLACKHADKHLNMGLQCGVHSFFQLHRHPGVFQIEGRIFFLEQGQLLVPAGGDQSYRLHRGPGQLLRRERLEFRGEVGPVRQILATFDMLATALVGLGQYQVPDQGSQVIAIGDLPHETVRPADFCGANHFVLIDDGRSLGVEALESQGRDWYAVFTSTSIHAVEKAVEVGLAVSILDRQRLTPRMREFKTLYPDIDITLILADTELDLGMRQADMAIRLAPPKQPDLIQRYLMTMHYHVFSSAEYLKAHGTPAKPKDLDDHDLVVYGDDARPPVENLNWLLSAGAKPGTTRTPVLRVNSIYGIYRAVQSGLGIGALPDYMSREATNLKEVLPELRGPSIEAYFVYPEELRNSKRIVVFRDFLVSRLNPDQF